MLGKILAVLAGAAAVASFFLPLAWEEKGGVRVSVSAYSVVRGVGEGDVEADDAAARGRRAAEIRATQEETEGVSAAVLLIWLAPIGVALVGVAALFTRFGRGLAVLGLLLGLLTGGIWLAFRHGTKDWESGAEVGLGVAMLGVAGVVGVLSGVVGLVAPERREPPPSPRDVLFS
jgi:hypothetical protein